MPKTFKYSGKALSIIQPWASAIAFAGKDIENRSWRTHYRGPVAIHASAKCWTEMLQNPWRVKQGGEKRPIIEWINKGRKRVGLELESEDNILCSHIIAIGMLVDCVEKSSSPWFGGPYGWVIQGIVPIEPVPFSGTLGLWDCQFKYRPL